jgi:hypothetical protein
MPPCRQASSVKPAGVEREGLGQPELVPKLAHALAHADGREGQGGAIAALLENHRHTAPGSCDRISSAFG